MSDLDSIIATGLQKTGISDAALLRILAGTITARASRADKDEWARRWVQARIDDMSRDLARSAERQATPPNRRFQRDRPPVRPPADTEFTDPAWRASLPAETLAELEWWEAELRRSRGMEEQSSALLYAEIRHAMETYAASITLEVTAKLLATPLDLGDGTQTTWGAATVEQFDQRRTMILKMARGDIETAARLTKAIEIVQTAGTSCLNDLGPAA
jgi:hypothetical protein